LATVLYYTGIAAALVRCCRRITRHDDATFRHGFRWGNDRLWEDEVTRNLFLEGLRAFDTEGPPS
jgi:hypothetical protein